MAYEVFKTILNKEAYFNTWESGKLQGLDTEMLDYIYMKYKLKCDVFNRDNFKCTNIHCEFPDSPLTIHHVKAQRNLKRYEKHKVRNCVVVCKTCHNAFNNAKRGITFGNDVF